jgi:hypothetical protein
MLIKLIAVILIATSAINAEVSSKNAEIKAEILAAIKYSLDNDFEPEDPTKECFVKNVGIPDVEIEAATSYKSSEEMRENRKHNKAVQNFLRLVEKSCEKAEREDIVKYIEREDKFQHQYSTSKSRLQCFSQKLSELIPDSPLLANYIPVKVDKPDEDCVFNINDMCRSAEDQAHEMDGINEMFDLKSCNLNNIVDRNEICTIKLRSVIARLDRSLPADLRVNEVLHRNNREHEVITSMLSCVREDVFGK